MKISGKSPSPMQNAETAKLGRPDGLERTLDKTTDKKTGKSSLGFDDIAGSSKVDLSDRARDVKRAKELATPDDSVDEAKVARLQKMIDDGKYKVDADAIADRLLDEHMKMGG